jgi:hypothetical protein
VVGKRNYVCATRLGLPKDIQIGDIRILVVDRAGGMKVQIDAPPRQCMLITLAAIIGAGASAPAQ